MINPLISIVMPFFNAKRYITEALVSILNQSYPNLEIICIDDFSTDDSFSLLLEYQKYDKRIVLSQNKLDKGIVGALNYGINKASGDIIARMDADDISLPNRIEIQYNYLHDNNYEFVGSPVIYIAEDGEKIGISSYYDDDSISKCLKYKSTLGHPTWMLYKEVYRRLNGYNNVSPAEDYDFLIKAVKAGVKISMTRQPLLKFRTQSKYGGTALTNGLVQRKMFNYVKAVYRGNKRYDQKVIKKIRTPSLVMKKLFYLSQLTYTQAMRNKHTEKYYLFVFFLILSILLSPYQLQFIMRNIMAKLMNKQK